MKKLNYIMIFNTILLPVIPLLFLYNQNAQYLYFPQILVAGIILITFVIMYFIIIYFIFKSKSISFIACLIFVVLIFAHNNLYHLVADDIPSKYLLYVIPLVAYILTYLCFKLFKNIDVLKYNLLIALFIFCLLLVNIYQFISNFRVNNRDYGIVYKSNFIIDEKLSNPNIYWIFCDGMLGFDAMEKYFNESQTELIKDLNKRGFNINKSAMLETGHSTSIAIPMLMSPDYYDRYMRQTYINHESYMKLRNSSYDKLYTARLNNELVLAFDQKGYSTIAISIDDQYFMPTTDFFYYVDVPFRPFENYYDNPNLIMKRTNDVNINNKSRIYAHNLGSILLGGIPGKVYDKFFSPEFLKTVPSTKIENVNEILLNSNEAATHYSLISSLYDSINSKNIVNPKLVIVHNLMAHSPFYLDENGNFEEDMYNISSYPNHHKYSTKVLVNLIDMIMQYDSDAIIVLQADHGLHGQSKEEIIEVFNNYDDVLNIWNSVFSAIRIPGKYQNGKENYPIENPLNITRYLVNSFVGENYEFIHKEKESE